MANSMNKEQAKQALKSGYGKSKALLKDKDKLDIFLRGLERKIEGIPMIGKELSISKKFCRRKIYFCPLWNHFSCY